MTVYHTVCHGMLSTITVSTITVYSTNLLMIVYPTTYYDSVSHWLLR
jgi:hypothetical protein